MQAMLTKGFTVLCYLSSLLVDWSVRCETPAGSVGQVRLLMVHSAKEAHRTPRGKGAPETEINYLHKHHCIQIQFLLSSVVKQDR